MGTVASHERGTSSSRYTILGRLASGGMADIYLVLASTAAGVDRYLVLKRVLAERARDPVFAEMFLDEARLAAQLQHPNIAQVYDVGKLEGTYFFTMEYVHGEDIRGLLHKLTRTHKHLPVNLALHIATGALAALEHAHERTTPDGKPLNIVHRDVTPSNVMISYEGAVKLLDFGVAKANERSTESRSGSIKGKIAYLSPEQVRATGDLDRRSDIYSLGIVLWEMLTRKRLYKRDSDFNTMLAITSEEVPRPSTIRPELSSEIDRVVMKALAKDRDQRYLTAGTMLEDLEAVATAERHSLSGTAMGRFMRETFGHKPPPWVDLKAPDDEPRPVTVTGTDPTASLGTRYDGPIDAYRGSPDSPLGPRDLDALATQLARARDLRPIMDPGRMSDSLDVIGAQTPTPSAAVAVPGPDRPTAPRKGHAGVLAVTMLATIAIGGAAYYLLAMRDQPPSTPPVVAQPESPPPAPVPPQRVPAPAATIVSAKEPDAVMRLCTGADMQNLSAEERKLCGIAACKLEARATALLYRDATQGDQRSAIEAACTDKGIALVADSAPAPAPPTNRTSGTKPTKPTKPAHTTKSGLKQGDPCQNPAYVEEHPLQCP